MNTVIIFGAGASVAEASNKPKVDGYNNMPPLDLNFFKICEERAFNESNNEDLFNTVANHLNKNFDIDVVKENYSLEYIYNLIYSEAKEEPRSCPTVNHVLTCLNILIRFTIAHTTNTVMCNNNNGIYGLLKLFVNEYPKSQLDIITFNYDLIVEKSLHLLQGNLKESKIFNINKCYPTIFKSKLDKTQPYGNFFPKHSGASIQIYKLHGSLNWFIESEANQHLNIPIEDSSNFYLTNDQDISTILNSKEIGEKGDFVVRPMIVPPTYDKHNFYKDILKPSWDTAKEKLSIAERIIFFGYSLPEADMKAHTMFLSALSHNKNNLIFDVIDNNSQICQRYIDKLPIGSLRFYKSVEDYKNQN